MSDFFSFFHLLNMRGLATLTAETSATLANSGVSLMYLGALYDSASAENQMSGTQLSGQEKI